MLTQLKYGPLLRYVFYLCWSISYLKTRVKSERKFKRLWIGLTIRSHFFFYFQQPLKEVTFGKMQIVEHFFLHKKAPLVINHNIQFFQMLSFIDMYRYLFMKKKVFNYLELHFSEVTSSKIHTLTILKLCYIQVKFIIGFFFSLLVFLHQFQKCSLIIIKVSCFEISLTDNGPKKYW